VELTFKNMTVALMVKIFLAIYANQILIDNSPPFVAILDERQET
jgi:hypothetical protein